MRLELPSTRLTRRRPDGDLQEIKPAPWLEINLEGLAVVAVGLAVGAAALLTATLVAKYLGRNSQG